MKRPSEPSAEKTAARKKRKVKSRKTFAELLAEANADIAETEEIARSIPKSTASKVKDGGQAQLSGWLEHALSSDGLGALGGESERNTSNNMEEDNVDDIEDDDIEEGYTLDPDFLDDDDDDDNDDDDDDDDADERRRRRRRRREAEAEDREEDEEEAAEQGRAGTGDAHDAPIEETASASGLSENTTALSWKNFSDVAESVPSELLDVMKAQGHTIPTPIQAQAWPIAMTGNDLVAVAVTGSGKTFGYLVPLFARVSALDPEEVEAVTWAMAVPRALVLAPTRELVQQIAAQATKMAPLLGLKVAAVYGGQSKGIQGNVLRTELPEVVVGTPGRLQEFLAVGPPPASWRPCISGAGAQIVVMDEADRMLEMGFEEQIRAVLRHCPWGRMKKKEQKVRRQTLMFTATWPEAVQAAAMKLVHSRSCTLVRIATDNTSTSKRQAIAAKGSKSATLAVNKDVSQQVDVLQDADKMAKLLKVVNAELTRTEQAGEAGARILVFVATKKRCDRVDAALQKRGFRTAGAIHGDKEQDEREKTLEDFRTGKAEVMVATDVAARGLDVPGVNLVVCFDFPMDIEAYVHRIGRTGRAGSRGRAHSFFTAEDGRHSKDLIKLLKEARVAIPQGLKEIAVKWSEKEKAHEYFKFSGKSKTKNSKFKANKGKRK
ncbi:hypothetical protein CYMTET_10393 [Cymbomonas tetramitiformis]|uniref:RNA helicase n=1 Tax=Cymbomonas tetramitiformis TaxID=36881 RepID=A0AAE0LEH8_9CHLO|nr:hypothetical protein CYMTET_10393 [Cymbomonas tetramitiformis]